MRRLLLTLAALCALYAAPAVAQVQGRLDANGCGTLAAGSHGSPGQYPEQIDANGHTCVDAPISDTLTTPASTLTLTSTTTAYSANQFIANNSTGTSVTVPSFAIQNTGAAIPRIRVYSDDTASPGWGSAQIHVDLWSAAPTFGSSYGDRSTFTPSTGTASHLAGFLCTFSSVYGDGVWGTCLPDYGNSTNFQTSAVGGPVYWTAYDVTASGTLTASKHLKVVPEVFN